MTTTTAPTVTRADWSSVTVREFNALAILTAPDPLAALNAAWDDVHAHNPFADPVEGPTRLTADGETWLADAVAAATGPDEPAAIAAARDAVTALGFLTIHAAARIAQAQPPR